MRHTVIRLVTLAIGMVALSFPGVAQSQKELPHAWLFGAWIGGLYPPPVTLSTQECLAEPVVIFTRDLVLRSTITSETYVQRRIDTALATANGTEIHLIHPLGATPAGAAVFGDQGDPAPIGFGCETQDVLHVQRVGTNEISFPHCTEFPYPLIRCVPH
jgi:hypothetical protein